MGRRKIEIQPITHERNRSVTFLKRKNGLFKKAYELGVLCSVDVAVIVFEERPGHHVKLFQYCSTDVQNIIQRHIHHDGERDTRGPADFIPGIATKAEDADIDIGDDEEDDEDVSTAPSRGLTKRRGDGLQLDPDYINPRSIPSPHSFPPNPAASLIQRQQSLAQRSNMPQRHYDQDQRQLNLAPERHHLHSSQTKRPRLGMESPHPSLGSFNSPHFRVPEHQTIPHGNSPISTQPHSPYQDYPQYNVASSQTFSSLQVNSPRDRAASVGDRTISGIPAGPRTIYGNVGPGAGASGRGSDTYNFLGGTDEGRRRSGTASTVGPGLGLDWPSSKPGPTQSQAMERDHRDIERDHQIERTTSGSSAGGTSAGPSTSSSTGGPDWLDFLSGNGSGTNSSTGTSAVSASTQPGGVSWERGVQSRTRTGGGSGSGGGDQMEGLSLFGLNSGGTKKEGG